MKNRVQAEMGALGLNRRNCLNSNVIGLKAWLIVAKFK